MKININLHKLSTKFTALLILFSIIPVIALGSISYFKAHSIIEESFKTSTGELLSESDRGLTRYLGEFKSNVDIISQNNDLKNYSKLNKDKIEEVFANFKGSKEEYMLVYFGSKDNELASSPKMNVSIEVTKRPWYIKAVENKGKAVFTEPYKDSETGKTIISVSKTVENNGSIVGVIAIDIDLTKLSKEMSLSKVGNNGYIYLSDANGILISHPDAKLIGTDATTKQTFWNEAKTNKNGFVEYIYNNESKYTVYTTNSLTGWKIFGSLDKSELTDDTNVLRDITLIILLIIIFASTLISFLIGKDISKNVNKLKKSFENASNGDFLNKSDVNSKDEFKDLSNSFNKMVDNISTLVGKVKQSSDTVFGTSTTLASMTVEVSASINQVAEAIEEISRGTMEQASNAQEGAIGVTKLGDKIDSISILTIEMDKVSNETSILSDKGIKMVEILSKKSNETKESTDEVSEIISKVDAGTKEITTILDKIKAITEQTNLLSLNASIESARAGEAGRGFAVVADEIRKLAEQSRRSSEEIKVIIDNIVKNSTIAVQTMSTTKKVVEEQDKAVFETGEVFNNIITSINQLIGNIDGIKVSINEVADDKNTIIKEIESISAISEEVSASTEEVSASTEEISATMEEFSKHSQMLTELSEQLKQDISNIKIN